ncbi:MAG: DNA repair protein RecN [Leptospiraceae bacterium]|nr:DNA repair protein RecN [Leptospiraceae bacterium]MDW7976845.1 DNA repair protein RecN [Leptospiraceae bacterium]
MLVELRIENFGIIEELKFRPGKGLNIITGETGSGKSLIIQALGVVLGERAGSAFVRNGANRAIVEAVFDLSKREAKRKEIHSLLEGYHIPSNGELLALKREITIDGKPKAYINNTLVSVQILKEIGSRLVEIHGQYENQRLMDPNYHLDYLDTFGGLDVLRNKVSELYKQWTELKKKLKVVSMKEEEKRFRKDYLLYAIQEIETFSPKENEFEELQKEKLKILNAGKLYEDFQFVYYTLQESDSSLLSNLQKIKKIFEKNQSIDGEITEYYDMLNECIYNIESIINFVREKKATLNYSPERLEDIEERLDGYRKLFKKYGSSTKEVLQKKAEFQKELHSIEMSDEEKELLRSKIQVIEEELREMSDELSKKRKEVIPVLEEKLKEGLEQLGMKGARIQVSFLYEGNEDNSKFTEKGFDQIEFLFCANEGEILLPLRKVASGGEFSRIALIMKSLLIDQNGPLCVIFDEIDSGVGGETAYTLGKKLKEISRNDQVIAITHLHQVASMANRHYRIYKINKNSRTFTYIERLIGENRLKELARMLGGSEPIVLEHAREILQKSQSQSQKEESLLV